MKIRLIRHATLIVTIGKYKILVDPMLAAKELWDPIPSGVMKRNPTTELPFDQAELKDMINVIDAVLLTHTHGDHFDPTAQELLSKDLPVICQPEDESKLKELGFKAVYPVGDCMNWEGIDFIRTGGQHGTGEIAIKMAPVSGFIIRAPEEASLYIAGDTVWCDEVEAAIEQYNPSVISVNAGAARFVTGDPITMGTEDILNVSRKSPHSDIIAVHMEAMNHCSLIREELKKFLKDNNLTDKVLVPNDGEEIDI